jgi:hypothetical protein
MGVAVTLFVLQMIYFPAAYHVLVKPVLGRCWRQYVSATIPALVSSLIMFGCLRAALLLFPHRSAHSYWGLALLVAMGGLIYLAVAFALFGKETRDLVKMVLHRGTPANPPPPGTSLPPTVPPAENVTAAGVANPGLQDSQ